MLAFTKAWWLVTSALAMISHLESSIHLEVLPAPKSETRSSGVRGLFFAHQRRSAPAAVAMLSESDSSSRS